MIKTKCYFKILLFYFCALLFSCSSKPEVQDPLNAYNVVWNAPSKNSAESMPLVGGDIGCNVWVENGDLLFYVMRSGSFSENGEYLKLGRFRVQLTPNPFENGGVFEQKLNLQDGYVEVTGTNNSGQEGKIKLWVDVFNPAIHVEVETPEPSHLNVAYESWRTQERELKMGVRAGRFGAFGLDGYPDKVMLSKDSIRETGKGILFYHRNPEDKLVTDVFLQLAGLQEYKDEIPDDVKDRTFGGLLFGEGLVFDKVASGEYQGTPYKSWNLKTENPKRSHHVTVATHIEQAETVAQWINNLESIAADSQTEIQKASAKTVTWWNDFWKRSYIFINPKNPNPSDSVWQMGRNYQLFRYQLGGNVFGEYPTKFNGGNLTFDPNLVSENRTEGPDWRAWGGAVFTAQNQRLLYWPMLKSGDFDAIIPQFELYRKGLKGSKARVEKYFDHEGAVYCEYASAPGIPFGDGWGWSNDRNYRIRGEEIPFGDPRATGALGFNDPVEKGVMSNPPIAYHWESQLEHAYMIMEYHRFTGNDIAEYMPFIEQSVIFFDEHYRKRQKMRNGSELGDDGKLVIYPSTSCESYKGATNPVDVISGLQACLNSILSLEEKYLSVREKEYYKGFLQRLPDYSFDEVDGLKVILPAQSWIMERNQELPQFYPLFPFDQFSLGDKEIEWFKNAYTVAPDFRKGNIISWHQDGIQFARMGMAQEAAEYNTKKLKDSPRRYPTFWGPGHDWVPDHNWGGSGMIGVQEMLLQTLGDQILLFPAWPKEWDVHFKLHAPKNTVIECEYVDGEIKNISVTPQTREKDIINLMPIKGSVNSSL